MIRNSIGMVLCVCVVFLMSMCANADETTHEHDMDLIKVNGSATVLSEPDEARIRMKVTENTTSIIEAKKNVDKKVIKIQNMMIEAGLKESDINAANFRVYKTPKPHPRQSLPISISEPIEYTISRDVTAVVKDLTRLDQILDAAIRIGTNEVQGVDFYSSKEEELRREALERAAENAQEKAAALAAKFGRSVGAVRLIQESGGIRPVAFRAENAIAVSGFSQGEVDITAQVYVEFEIE
ncbi:SIMPL domain-containing protein [Candidatus Omnitrophota bacterium]